jgi:hypothetical protein
MYLCDTYHLIAVCPNYYLFPFPHPSPLYFIISNTVLRQICWFVDSMTIAFTLLYAVFYNCHLPLGFLKGQSSSHNCVGKNSAVCSLFVSYVYKLFIYKTQTNSCCQFYAAQNAYNSCVLFYVMTEGN